MKLTTHRVSAPLHTPFITALRTATHVESLLVEVSDGELSGWGEAPQVWKVTGDSLAGSEACIEGPITTALDGLGPDDLTEALRRVQGAAVGNFGAKDAVDVALHDLAARRRGQTLHGFLGSTVDVVRTDVTLSVGDAAALAAAGGTGSRTGSTYSRSRSAPTRPATSSGSGGSARPSGPNRGCGWTPTRAGRAATPSR